MKAHSTVMSILTAVEDGPISVDDALKLCACSESHARQTLQHLVHMGELSARKEKIDRRWVTFYSQPVQEVPKFICNSVFNWAEHS